MPSANFEAAAKAVKQLKAKPSQDELLQLYALYKQATQNPKFESADKPGTFDFTGKAKYRAWENVVKEGITPADAEKKYIALVAELKQKHGYDPSKTPETVGS
ncbi:hypothetical protein EPUS_02293 [Endocarpon pusillum Z07020]|uniref:ACB domain-containing protein n=1 Tax=Endocarpon pusillum (strain Z07020 / HMAS-L-300199) TaxID=1263415 RepID=U1I3W1_ENDPU|nr:uncharacterized protein EPUS_02293 [Endocarpon pusillum Z07020]ERF76754.1 hypothetical protein EPUS_02293 [Endocarpon pusillum Z07020]